MMQQRLRLSSRAMVGVIVIALGLAGCVVMDSVHVPVSAAPPVIELTGGDLDWKTVMRVLHADSVIVRLSVSARDRMAATRRGALEAVAGGQRVYGWNQALGPLKDKKLSDNDQKEFQRRVLRSNAAGVGAALPERVVRLALVLRANAMARSRMGVRPELVDRFLAMVNAGVLPVMPEIGSLGIGDLQPMAAAGLSMIGEANPVLFRGQTTDAQAAFRAAGLPATFELESGEALPVISGSSVLLARYIDAIDRLGRDVQTFHGALAMFLEATRAEQGAFDARTHDERGIPEEVAAARQVRVLVCGTGWMTDEGRRRAGESTSRIQDSTSVRAEPQIVGGLLQTLGQAQETAIREANASTSNPLVFPKRVGGYEFVMGGNWDGSLMAHEIDTLNAQITDLGVLSQELSGRLMDPKWSHGLPANLAGGAVGLNSGLVQAESVAAALVPEMQVGASPASVLSRPVKGGQEDHNSMAMASMRQLAANLDRFDIVVGVQLLLGAQGIDLLSPTMAGLPMGSGTIAVHAAIRKRIAPLGDDRYLTPDVETATNLVRDGAVAAAVTQNEHHVPAECAT